MKFACFAVMLISIIMPSLSSAQVTVLNPRTTEEDPFAFPHAMEQNGTIIAMAFDVSGGQYRSNDPLTGAGNTDFQGTFSLYGNNSIYQLYADALAGKAHTATFDMYGVAKTGSDASIPNMTSVELQPCYLELPACDVDAKNPRGAHVDAVFRRLNTGSIPAGNTGIARMIAKKQKLWSPANFRLSVNGKTVPRDLTTNHLKIALRTIQNPDGTTTLHVDSSDIVFTIPAADGAPFQDLFNQTLAGKEQVVPVQLDYLDDSGNPLLSVTQNVAIVSVGPVDFFQAASLQTTTQVVCEGRSQIMLTVYPSSF